MNVFPDGTTEASREAFQRTISKAVVEVSKDLQAVIDGRFGIISLLHRPTFSIPVTYRQRLFLERAIFDLKAQFLPTVLEASRNPNKPLKETAQIADEYLEVVAKQVDVALGAEAGSRFSSLFKSVVRNALDLGQKGVAVGSEAIAHAVDSAGKAAAAGLLSSPTTAIIALAAAAIGVSYVVRSFR